MPNLLNEMLSRMPLQKDDDKHDPSLGNVPKDQKKKTTGKWLIRKSGAHWKNLMHVREQHRGIDEIPDEGLNPEEALIAMEDFADEYGEDHLHQELTLRTLDEIGKKGRAEKDDHVTSKERQDFYDDLEAEEQAKVEELGEITGDQAISHHGGSDVSEGMHVRHRGKQVKSKIYRAGTREVVGEDGEEEEIDVSTVGIVKVNRGDAEERKIRRRAGAIKEKKRRKRERGPQWAKDNPEITHHPSAERHKRVKPDRPEPLFSDRTPAELEAQAILEQENLPLFESEVSTEDAIFEKQKHSQEVVRELFRSGFKNITAADLFPVLFTQKDERSVRIQQAYENRVGHIRDLLEYKLNDDAFDKDRHKKLKTIGDAVIDIYKKIHALYAEHHNTLVHDVEVNKYRREELYLNYDETGSGGYYSSPEEEIMKLARLWVALCDRRFDRAKQDGQPRYDSELDIVRDHFRKGIDHSKISKVAYDLTYGLRKRDAKDDESEDAINRMIGDYNVFRRGIGEIMNLFPYELEKDNDQLAA